MFTKHYKLILIILVILLSSCQPTTIPIPTATNTPTGGITGTILDANTGAPIPDAQVTIAGQAGVFTVASDSDGHYGANDLVAGAYLINVQAVGYYVGVIQIGIVANVVSAGNVMLEPDVAPTTPTPPVTATPASTSLPPATPTSAPTEQPTATPTASPTPQPAPKSSSSTKPSSHTNPQRYYAAPQLIQPHDGATFHGIQRLIFAWEGTLNLGPDEYYVISIPHPRGAEQAWIKTTIWTAPDYLYLLRPGNEQLTWNVTVRRHTGEYANGQWNGPIISAISETRHFSWHIPDSPVSPLARPVSPIATPVP